MADFNDDQNGVFGGVQFDAVNNGTGESTSYFEGTIGNTDGSNTVNGTTGNGVKTGIFGTFGTEQAETVNNGTPFETVKKDKAIAKQSVWSKIRSFLFQEIDLNAPIVVELTPYQQKVEDEINAFLHQEVSFKGIANLFKGNK